MQHHRGGTGLALPGLILLALGLAGCAGKGESNPALGGPMSKANGQMAAVLGAHERLGPKPIERLTPEEARRQPSMTDAVIQLLQERGEAAPKRLPAVGRVETKSLPLNGAQIPVRIYTPPGKAPPGGWPTIVYYHGGGWVIGNLDVYDPSCRALCTMAKAVVVSVQYRLAPEYKYPTAHEDAYAALQYVAMHTAEFGGDPARVAVAGESAGGNLATTVCLLAAARRGMMPVHQLVVYPVTNYASDTASYKENAEARPLGSAMMPWFFGHYLNSPADGASKLISPISATEAELRQLPPATIITAGIDPLRDDGVNYAKKLRSAGVDVAHRDYPSVTHEFFGMGRVVGDAKDAEAFAAKRLRERFGR